MTTIHTSPHATGMPLADAAGPAQAGASAGTSTPAGAAAPLPPGVSSEQAQMALLLEDAGGGAAGNAAAQDSEAEPTSNSNGAPYLPESADLSADYMAAWLSVMTSKTLGGQAEALKKQADRKTQDQQQQLDRANAIIEKNIEAAKKAKAARKRAGILGWVKKSITLVVAVVAVAALTAATGPAAPLMLALALGCLTNALLGMASDISAASGGPRFPSTLSSLSQAVTVAILKAMLPDDKLAKNLGIMLAGLAGCYSGAVLVDPAFAGQLVSGAAILGGTGERTAADVMAYTTVAAAVASAIFLLAAGGALKGAQTADKAIRAARAVGGITQASVGAFEAKANLDVDMLRARQIGFQADTEEINALMTRLESQWQDVEDALKDVVEALDESRTSIDAILDSESQNKAGIIAKMNGHAAV